ncbi:hypothetical protein BJF83_10505 [Nocardiopsis sp. CNR-923]|uniref:hypothetical protein n=1 Tax=Nocardiopsis sp. CNR-923 TaxID=1904965 RepID=UPI0009616DB0|nr:hypothetical protein [Nocardiopsis sp. CNR-923]OLT29781.1 hypothetical protein BJF83_10505 [Nocardiopsis sp. CNR-923]
MPKRTVRRVAAVLLAAPMLALAAPAVSSADIYGGWGPSWSYGYPGYYGGWGGWYGGAFYSQSGSFAGPYGAASYDVFSFAR